MALGFFVGGGGGGALGAQSSASNDLTPWTVGCCGFWALGSCDLRSLCFQLLM